MENQIANVMGTGIKCLEVLGLGAQLITRTRSHAFTFLRVLDGLLRAKGKP